MRDGPRGVENTTRMVEEQPLRALLLSVEEMEARGVRQLIASDLLPVDCGDPAEYAALGFLLGDGVADDPVFRYALLPAGWRRVATENPRYMDIVDETGRRRVAVFYKAAYYDRRATMRVVREGE